MRDAMQSVELFRLVTDAPHGRERATVEELLEARGRRLWVDLHEVCLEQPCTTPTESQAHRLALGSSSSRVGSGEPFHTRSAHVGWTGFPNPLTPTNQKCFLPGGL